MRIDLNADVGESFGVYTLGADEELLDWVTSASIACGFHAGDPATMRTTAALCVQKSVAIGAHPGLPDRMGFGRRAMNVTPQETHDLVVYQVGALHAVVHAMGGTLRHVKLHGALYNMVSSDPRLADAVASAVKTAAPGLRLFALAGSEQVSAAQRLGLEVTREAFVDRTYQPDGSLTPRDRPDALIANIPDRVRQGLGLVCDGRVVSADGTVVEVQADTLCVHGDDPDAVAVARALRQALGDAGVTVVAPESV